MVGFCKGSCNQQRKNKGCICVNFHSLWFASHFSPTDSFIWASSRIASIKFLKRVTLLCISKTRRTVSYLSSINKNSVIWTISHQICIVYVMLHNATTQDDDTTFVRFYRHGIDVPQILKYTMSPGYDDTQKPTSTMSILIPGAFLTEWKYNISPREPSVKAGQNIGTLFLNAQ